MAFSSNSAAVIERSLSSAVPRSSQQAEDSAPRARQFAGLQFWDSHNSEICVPSADRDGNLSFAACIQVTGRAILQYDGKQFHIAENEVFLAAPLSRLSWQPADHQSGCVIASGGPAFSLRFRPHRHSAVQLDGRHPIGLLLKDCILRLNEFIPAADCVVIQKIAEILADLIEIAINETNNVVSDQTFLSHLLRIEDQLDNPCFDVITLAAELGTTLRSLQKRFRQFNTTPREWMSQRRLERTRRKLDDPLFANLSIKQIAFSSGFRDFSHFSRSFKSAFGTPPRTYRR
jgi:AraC-like DNA-binding protein